MTDKSPVPHGENLRNAIRWLSEHHLKDGSAGPLTQEIIEQASIKFDLTPLEEEFLLRKFVDQSQP